MSQRREILGTSCFDISEIDKVNLLKAFWDTKFYSVDHREFDYQLAEKSVSGYIVSFCGREMNLDFSKDCFVILSYTDVDDRIRLRDLIERMKAGTFVSFTRYHMFFYSLCPVFKQKLQEAFSEFEFSHKKSQIFFDSEISQRSWSSGRAEISQQSWSSKNQDSEREYVPKMFQTVKEIDSEEFDNFYGRGSFDMILEKLIQREMS
jgi:hypothetical protein